MGQVVKAKTGKGLIRLEDNKTHTNRFEIKSESSDRVYIVAQKKGATEWQCSCPGWIFHRNCKHLKALAPILKEVEEGKLIGKGDSK
jgi:hypothetical protein